ncbi:hypothetical protein COOONC_11718 [Cooperia oncophora]
MICYGRAFEAGTTTSIWSCGTFQSFLRLAENGHAAGDKNDDSAQMETDESTPAKKDGEKKAEDQNDSKEVTTADDQSTAAAATNDEEMLEDPLVDVPAATAPAPAKSADNKITAQSSVKTPVQAPVNDDKEKDVASRSIWVRGLTSATKAADLKVLCTQYGKVVRAKIYTSKKQSTSACYGYVTMADSASADKAAAAMHKTQIKGRTISVEKVEIVITRGMLDIVVSYRQRIRVAKQQRLQIRRRLYL